MGGNNLNVITPFSRTKANLEAIFNSISPTEKTKVKWIIVCQHDLFETAKKWSAGVTKKNLELEILMGNTPTSIFGNSYRNQGIENCLGLGEEWVYFMDDDNIFHPGFWDFFSAIEKFKEDLIFFPQIFPNGNIRLRPEEIRVGGVDTAMYIFKSKCVQNLRWLEDHYTADGIFAEQLALKNTFFKIHNPLCFYNFSRPITKFLESLPAKKKSYLLPKRALDFFKSLYLPTYFFEVYGYRSIFYIQEDSEISHEDIVQILCQQKYFYEIKKWDGQPVVVNLENFDYENRLGKRFFENVLRGNAIFPLKTLSPAIIEYEHKIIICPILDGERSFNEIYTEALRTEQPCLFMGSTEDYDIFSNYPNISYFSGGIHEVISKIGSCELVVGNNPFVLAVSQSLLKNVIIDSRNSPKLANQLDAEFYGYQIV